MKEGILTVVLPSPSAAVRPPKIHVHKKNMIMIHQVLKHGTLILNMGSLTSPLIKAVIPMFMHPIMQYSLNQNNQPNQEQHIWLDLTIISKGGGVTSIRTAVEGPSSRVT